jgi:hypothetical protein
MGGAHEWTMSWLRDFPITFHMFVKGCPGALRAFAGEALGSQRALRAFSFGCFRKHRSLYPEMMLARIHCIFLFFEISSILWRKNLYGIPEFGEPE